MITASAIFFHAQYNIHSNTQYAIHSDTRHIILSGMQYTMPTWHKFTCTKYIHSDTEYNRTCIQLAKSIGHCSCLWRYIYSFIWFDKHFYNYYNWQTPALCEKWKFKVLLVIIAVGYVLVSPSLFSLSRASLIHTSVCIR